MATAATGSSRPGVSVGPTSEFSLFFQIKPGEGEDRHRRNGDAGGSPEVVRGARLPVWTRVVTEEEP